MVYCNIFLDYSSLFKNVNNFVLFARGATKLTVPREEQLPVGCQELLIAAAVLYHPQPLRINSGKVILVAGNTYIMCKLKCFLIIVFFNFNLLSRVTSEKITFMTIITKIVGVVIVQQHLLIMMRE